MFTQVSPNPAVSVIVPIYNVQDYLAESLGSLAQQNICYPIEILLIDDGSTDDSKKLCEEFVATYPNLARLICLPENMGLAVVRNVGIKAAVGDYFTFVDADDVLPQGALQHLYEAALAHGADIVKGNNCIFNEHGEYAAAYNVKKIKIYEGNAILSMFLDQKRTRGHTWGKLFLRSSFVHITNTPGVKMAEDTLYCAEIFACAKKIVLINTTVYRYRLRKLGLTGRKFETGTYRWWLYSIENCEKFTSTADQKARFKELQIRTLLQLVREARTLGDVLLAEVVTEVRARQNAWKLTSLKGLIKSGVSTKFLLSFIKFKLTLRQLEKRVSHVPVNSVPSDTYLFPDGLVQVSTKDHHG